MTHKQIQDYESNASSFVSSLSYNINKQLEKHSLWKDLPP